MASGRIKLKKAGQEDVAEACQLALAAQEPLQQAYRQKIGSELYQIFFSDWQAEKCQIVARDLASGRGYVALAAGRLIGFISYTVDEQRKIATITAHAGPNGWPDQAGSAQLYSHLLSCLKKEGIAYLKASCSLDEEAALLRQASARAGLAQGLASITYYQKISDLILARPSQLNLVPAEKKHLAGACELACQAWSGIHAEYARLLGPDLHAGIFSDWQLEKCQAVEKELSGGRGYLALAAGQLAGFISYALDDKNNYGIIGNNAVHSAWRGQGLAGLLYQHVFACLKKEGVAYVKVTTGLDAGHAPARRAYAKAGFALGIARINYLQKIQA